MSNSGPTQEFTIMAKSTKKPATKTVATEKAAQAKASIFDTAGKVAANPATRNVGKGLAVGFGATLGYLGANALYKAVAL